MKVAQWFLLLILFSLRLLLLHLILTWSQRRIWFIFRNAMQTPCPAILLPEMLRVEENFMGGLTLKCGCPLQRCKRLNHRGPRTPEKREFVSQRRFTGQIRDRKTRAWKGQKSMRSRHGGIWGKKWWEEKTKGGGMRPLHWREKKHAL